MPHQSVPEEKRRFARHLRRAMTEAEDRLWQELRGRRLDGIKFRRQVPVGRYVADFLCAEAMLIVEVDGSQHAESVRDIERDSDLKRRGFRVLRFWNDDVLRDMNAVCDTIIAYVRDRSLQPWR
ncbi:endonuclease domain-containing protein [Aquibium sp. LZ166]|uniref:Endonuclease domain-containing protein n=1 Tax=Aquibium pacificus TaxID=3153579 RepID=A0ABV3SIU8_9HYPH